MWWLSPINWLLCALVLLGIGSCVQRLRGWILFAGMALAAVSVLAMTPLFANPLLRMLETDTVACLNPPPTLAIVLAGGVDGPPAAANDFSRLTLASRRRAERAVAWWREQPGRKLLISGGTLFEGAVAESRVMAAYVENFGVPMADVEIEEQSTNTWESARILSGQRPAIPRSVVLITSSVHMRRAAYAMETAGFQLCPLATDSRVTPFGLPGYLIPQVSATEKTEAALHELVGLVYYRWLYLRSRPSPPAT